MYLGYSCQNEKLLGMSMNTYPICDSARQRSARRSFAPLQKSRRNHHSYVRTEAYQVQLPCQRKRYPLYCGHSPILIKLQKNCEQSQGLCSGNQGLLKFNTKTSVISIRFLHSSTFLGNQRRHWYNKMSTSLFNFFFFFLNLYYRLVCALLSFLTLHDMIYPT